MCPHNASGQSGRLTHNIVCRGSSLRIIMFLSRRYTRAQAQIANVGARDHTAKSQPSPVRKGGEGVLLPSSISEAPGNTSMAPTVLATACNRASDRQTGGPTARQADRMWGTTACAGNTANARLVRNEVAAKLGQACAFLHNASLGASKSILHALE